MKPCSCSCHKQEGQYPPPCIECGHFRSGHPATPEQLAAAHRIEAVVSGQGERDLYGLGRPWKVSTVSYDGHAGVTTEEGLYVCSVPHKVAEQIVADHNARLAATDAGAAGDAVADAAREFVAALDDVSVFQGGPTQQQHDRQQAALRGLRAALATAEGATEVDGG